MNEHPMSILTRKHNMEILVTILRWGKVKATDLRNLTSNIGDISKKLEEMESFGLVTHEWEVADTGSNVKMYRLTEDMGLHVARLYYASRCICKGIFDIGSSPIGKSLDDEFGASGELSRTLVYESAPLPDTEDGRRRKKNSSEPPA